MSGRRSGVFRVAEDPDRGTFTLQAKCGRCNWRGDRHIIRDEGSDKRNAPATNLVAHEMLLHQASCGT